MCILCVCSAVHGEKKVGVIFPGARVTGDCGHLKWVLETEFRSYARVVSGLSH